MNLSETKSYIIAEFDYNLRDVEICRSAPGGRRFDADNKRWLLRKNLANYEHIKNYRPDLQLPGECEDDYNEKIGKKRLRDKVARKEYDYFTDESEQIPYKLPPFAHQREAFQVGRNFESFAYLMEQGTGKTKVLLDDAAYQYRQGLIRALVVVCPNSVKTNWVDPAGGADEVSKHMAPDIGYATACWDLSKASYRAQLAEVPSTTDKLIVIAMNVEAFSHKQAPAYLLNLIDFLGGEVMLAVDESTRIKHSTSARSKALLKIAEGARFRRILTGTPIVKSPMHAFSQFKFLDPDILGLPSFTAFQARYGVKGGYKGKEIVGYQNLDELQHRIYSASYRKLKSECLDLPPKIYMPNLECPMTADMRKHYNEMRKDMITRYAGQTLAATIVLTMYLRLQQITAGLLPILDEEGKQVATHWIEATPPKMQEVLDQAESVSGKFLVWGNFKPEIARMCELLNRSGTRSAAFYGDTPEAERVLIKRSFEDPQHPLRCLVINAATGGIGLTFNQAEHNFYITNTARTEDRVQSEDRSHRIGKATSVSYTNVVCPGTVDMKMLQIISGDINLSGQILGDDLNQLI